MANDIKQKIVLEGEQQYKNAIKDAQRNLKTLRSELKAETAELGANATAQEKNAAKIKSLKAQIKEQEKIVKANKDALEEVKEKYADNADAIAKYEQKLNDSRTALANMKNELDNVGQGFKGVEANAAQATVATKSVADALGGIGDIGESVSSAIETVFMGLMDTVTDVAKEIWDLIAETAAKADRWGDLAGFYGSTAEEVQRVQKAIEYAGGSFEDFISLMDTIQFKGKEDKLTEWLGLSGVNFDNEVQHAMAALSLMNEKKEELGTGKFNDQIAAIFGSKSAGFLQLVDKYGDIIDASYELRDKGYLMSGKEIETMAAVEGELTKIENKWNDLKEKFAAGFGQVTLDIATKAEGALDALAEYFNAKTDGERDEALKKLEQNVTDIFITIGDAITAGVEVLDKVAENLKNSENPIVQGLGTLLGGIVDLLEWLTVDNANNFKEALLIIAGVWAAGKVVTMVTTIAQLASNLATLKMAGGFQAILGILSGNGMAADGAAAGASWGKAFAGAVLKAAPWLIGLYTLLNPADTGDELGNNDLIDKNGNLTEEAKAYGYELDEHGDLVQNPEKVDPQYVSKEMQLWQQDQQRNNEMNQRQPMTDAQWAAAQKWWDEVERGKDGEFTDEEFEEMEKIFAGNEEVLDKLFEMIDYLKQSDEETNGKNTWKDMEDLPAYWWQTQGGNTGNTDGLTTQDARTMTQAVQNMPNAVKSGLSGVKVYMDRVAVGNLVADEVSKQIASMIIP